MEISGETKVPAEWTDGTEMTVQQWGQREYDFGYKAGGQGGVAMCVNHLRAMAGNSFIAGEDARANMLRMLAEELSKLPHT